MAGKWTPPFHKYTKIHTYIKNEYSWRLLNNKQEKKLKQRKLGLGTMRALQKLWGRSQIEVLVSIIVYIPLHLGWVGALFRCFSLSARSLQHIPSHTAQSPFLIQKEQSGSTWHHPTSELPPEVHFSPENQSPSCYKHPPSSNQPTKTTQHSAHTAYTEFASIHDYFLYKMKERPYKQG